MRKQTIIGVIVLMSISLLGVVGLQLYWINDAIKVKQEQFDRSVNEALTNVVDKLETQEAVSVVAQQMAALNEPTSPPPADEASKQKAPTATPGSSQSSKSAPKPTKVQPIPVTQAKETGEAATAGASGKAGAAKQTITYTVTTPAAVSEFQRVPDHNIYIQAGALDSLKALTQLQTANDAARQLAGKAKASAPQDRLNVVTFPEDTAQHRAFFQNGKVYFRQEATAQSIVRELTPLQEMEKISDSVAILYRLKNQPVRISIDTLVHVAQALHKQRTARELAVTLKPAEASSITVRNDSIFISERDKKGQVFYRHAPKPEKSKTFWQQTYKVKEAKPLKEATAVQASAPVKGAEAVEAIGKPVKAKNKEINATEIDKIEVKQDKLNDVVQKMVVEYAVKDAPLQQRLNLHHLPDLLKTELQHQGIQLDFGYWVVSGTSDTVITKHLEGIKEQAFPKYEASLFPNDIFEKSDYLGLYFPDSKTYALRSLWGMLALSAFFTLVIIATFGTTIHIIYKQKKLSEMKNDFINNMTHEFKTPIATISLATDSIANPKVYEHPDRIRYYTGIIREENKRMNAQVENVLQIAQLEKNEFRMNLQPVDVHALILKAVESIQLQVSERLGQITVQLDALQHELRSDEVHLYNVICNLLDNANKYSPTSPDICLLTRNVPNGLAIMVEDKGIGMSKDTQQRVFEKFYRVPTGNLHNVKGFGLGLSYVKAIVQAHHGDIKLKSEPGKGSRFEIFLPLS